MSGRVERPGLCLVAVLALLAVGGAMPVMADHVGTVSEHTTDSDFSNAQTLDNLSIEGVGDDARLELRPESFSGGVDREPDGSSMSSTSEKRGLTIETNNYWVYGLTVQTSSNTQGATHAYLLDSNQNVIETATISGGEATFDTRLDANTKYYVAADADGSSYTAGYKDSPSSQSSTALDIPSGYHNGEVTSRMYSFNDLTYDYDAPTDDGRYVSATHPATGVEEGYVDLGLDNTTADITWQAHDGSSWTTVATDTVTSSGEVTTSLSGGYSEWRVDVQFSPTGDGTADLNSEGVRAPSSAVALDNASASPSGGEAVSSSPVTLEIDVSDADFGTTQGDDVELEWYHNDELVGTTTHTSNETASIEADEGLAGTNEWYAVATDNQGHETTSQTFTYEAPSELEIRNVHNQTLINTTEIQVQFYHSGDVVTRETTSDGTVDLSGVGAETEILVDADADGYYSRSIIIESIYDQQIMYLLPDDADTDAVQPRFRLNDPSGQFVESESDLFIERPINNTDGNVEWFTVAGDEFGSEGYTTWLEEGVRYRLILRNEEGDRRTVGSFRPTATETVELEVEGIQYQFQMDEENVEYSIEYDDDLQQVEFAYVDHDDATERLTLEIYEQGNESNSLASESWAPGNDVTYEIPADNETNWVVEFEADRGDEEDLSEVKVVGAARLDIGPDLDPRWSTIAGMGMLVVVGGLFGRGRPEVGAIAVSVLGGVLWMIGWMPGATTGAMIVVALFVSILFYARGGGGGVR